MVRTFVIVAILFSILLLPSLAAGAGATVLTFDPSVRAEAMGGAGVATHWGGDVDAWANPALLPWGHGLRYTDMNSMLAAGLADDIELTDRQITFAAYGVGLLYAQSPLSGTKIDMGSQMDVDEDNNETGEYSPWMEGKRLGVGIRLAQALEFLLGREDDDLSRLFEVSAGYVRTSYEQDLGSSVLLDAASGTESGTVASYGYLIRLSPLAMTGLADPQNALGGIEVNLAYGSSLLNDTDEMLEYDVQSDPYPRSFVDGWSVQVQTGFPTSARASLEETGRGWLADALTPLISLGYGSQDLEPGYMWNEETLEYDYEHDTRDAYREESTGWELSLCNVVHLRRGHRKAEYGAIDGDTTGWGFGFEVPRYGGIRFNHAEVPQATGLPDVERDSWSIWANVLSW